MKSTRSNATVSQSLAAHIHEQNGIIKALRTRCAELEAEQHVCGSGDGCLSKEALIDAAEERCAALEKDAARYQAIRTGLEVDPDNSGIVISLIDDFGGSTLHGEDADSAIDAAMASVPKES